MRNKMPAMNCIMVAKQMNGRQLTGPVIWA
jgi:hypothetical protein